MLKAAKNGPGNFDNNLQTKAKFGKYLKEKCYEGNYQQLSLKYFEKSFSIPKLLSKVS